MSFSNVLVDPADLPRAADLDWTAMPPEHRREVLVQSLITLSVFLLAAVLVGLLSQYPPELAWVFRLALPAAVLLPGVALTALALKRVSLKGYALRTHDVAYRSGLFWRKVVVLPFNRVQHVEVSSGPLQRRFGLASLKFYTAGGSGVDLKIDGLLSADAERLRAHILERSAAAVEAD